MEVLNAQRKYSHQSTWGIQKAFMWRFLRHKEWLLQRCFSHQESAHWQILESRLVQLPFRVLWLRHTPFDLLRLALALLQCLHQVLVIQNVTCNTRSRSQNTSGHCPHEEWIVGWSVGAWYLVISAGVPGSCPPGLAAGAGPWLCSPAACFSHSPAGGSPVHSNKTKVHFGTVLHILQPCQQKLAWITV